MKQYNIHKIKIKLTKTEILNRVKDITIPEKGFYFRDAISNLVHRQYFLCNGRFYDDEFSLTYMPHNSKGDILVPRVNGKVAETENGCDVDLFFSITRSIICFFAWWILCTLVIIIVSPNLLYTICHIVLCIFILWSSKRHCLKRVKDTVEVLNQEVFKIEKEKPTISTEIREAERQLEEQYKGIVK